jgi:transcriptional antiterminator NusG
MEGVAKWYIIHTFAGYEDNVKNVLTQLIINRNLQDMIQDIAIPVETVKEIKNGKEKITERKIFPGYVYVKMIHTNETWYIVRNTRGVTGFVGPEGYPTPLTDDEFNAIFGDKVDDTPKDIKIEISYKIGDTVKVLTGPMVGFLGEVTNINLDDKTVEVLVDFFGGKTPATLPITDVEAED